MIRRPATPTLCVTDVPSPTILLSVPAEGAIQTRDDAFPSASKPFSVGTARKSIVPVTEDAIKKPVVIPSASESASLSTARMLEPALRRSSRLVGDKMTCGIKIPGSKKIVADVNVPLRASKRAPPAPQCATPAAKVPPRASKRIPPARCATPTICETDAISVSSVGIKIQVKSPSADSTLAQNNCCRCLEDEQMTDDDTESDNDNEHDENERSCTNRKRLAGAHCKRNKKTGRGSMQANGAQKISPGRLTS
jgi:hypothetical protein